MADKLLNITMVADRAVVKLAAVAPSVMQSLNAKVTSITIELQRHVIEDKLSGEVLNVRTGNLRRSIQQKVEATATAVLGRVYSDGSVKYAAIHEFGGTIHMPAREAVVRLRTTIEGDLMRQAQYGNLARFAKSSHARVSERQAHVGAYDIHMPERSFMRSSLADQAADIKDQLIEAAHLGATAAGK